MFLPAQIVRLVGNRENGTSPYTTEVATGTPTSLSLVNSPNNGTGENDLFAATTAADGSTYAVGWYINASGSAFVLVNNGGSGGIRPPVPLGTLA